MLVKSHLWQALSNINFHWLFPYSFPLKTLFFFFHSKYIWWKFGSTVAQLQPTATLQIEPHCVSFFISSSFFSYLISSHQVNPNINSSNVSFVVSFYSFGYYNLFSLPRQIYINITRVNFQALLLFYFIFTSISFLGKCNGLRKTHMRILGRQHIF